MLFEKVKMAVVGGLQNSNEEMYIAKRTMRGQASHCTLPKIKQAVTCPQFALEEASFIKCKNCPFIGYDNNSHIPK